MRCFGEPARPVAGLQTRCLIGPPWDWTGLHQATNDMHRIDSDLLAQGPIERATGTYTYG